jgi:hypothetical protein
MRVLPRRVFAIGNINGRVIRDGGKLRSLSRQSATWSDPVCARPCSSSARLQLYEIVADDLIPSASLRFALWASLRLFEIAPGDFITPPERFSTNC